MSYSARQIVEFIEKDLKIGGEIVCAGSYDEFDFEEEQCNEEEITLENEQMEGIEGMEERNMDWRKCKSKLFKT